MAERRKKSASCSIMKKTELSLAIKDYLNKNYKKNPSVKEIAEHFFVSVSTACHCFKADFGIGIKKYLTEKKMDEAKKFIENGENPKRVCQKLNYENYTTFYRNYKKHFGVSPSEKE